jgi:hypothetical protein
MDRYPKFVILGTFCFVLLLFGCDRNAKPATEATPEQPILRSDFDTRTIVEQAVMAHGGEKAFSRWNCGYVKYRISGSIAPQPGEATVEDTFQLPGHFKRIALAHRDGEDRTLVFVDNDDQGWEKIGDGPVKPTSHESVTQKTEHAFAGFFKIPLLLDKEIEMTRLGEVTIDGRQAIGIRARSTRLGQVDFYFNARTGLLIKSSKTLARPDQDKPVMIDAFLDDYKEVQGGMVPMRIKGEQDGKPFLDVTILEVKFVDQFDDSTFAKP